MQTDWMIGRWIVVATAMTGGSSGRDSYPDGWKVTCQRDTSGDDSFMEEWVPVRCSFFQSGSFSAMIEDIKPVGRARATWRVE